MRDKETIQQAIRKMAPSEVDDLCVELIMAIQRRIASGYAGSELLHIDTKLDSLIAGGMYDI